MATCPECDAELEIDDDDLEEMEVGDPWDCEACGGAACVSPAWFRLDSDSDDEDDEEDELLEEAVAAA